MTFDVIINGKPHQVDIRQDEGRWLCRLDGNEVDVDGVYCAPDVISLLIGGQSYEVKRERQGTDTHIIIRGARFSAEVRDPRALRTRKAAAEAAGGGPKKLAAAMPGKVIRILVSEGDEVEAAQGLVVVEAMKMQNEMKSPKKGRIKQVLVKEGGAVTAGDVMVIVE